MNNLSGLYVSTEEVRKEEVREPVCALMKLTENKIGMAGNSQTRHSCHHAKGILKENVVPPTRHE